jgi:hypothetical protein
MSQLREELSAVIPMPRLSHRNRGALGSGV